MASVGKNSLHPAQAGGRMMGGARSIQDELGCTERHTGAGGKADKHKQHVVRWRVAVLDVTRGRCSLLPPGVPTVRQLRTRDVGCTAPEHASSKPVGLAHPAAAASLVLALGLGLLPVPCPRQRPGSYGATVRHAAGRARAPPWKRGGGGCPSGARPGPCIPSRPPIPS